LTVEKIFGALRLGTEKGNLQKRAVTTATATGADEFDPIFQLCDRAFKRTPIDLFKEPSGWLAKRSLGCECQSVKETHDSMTKSLSRLAVFMSENICVQACPFILLKKIKTVLPRKGEFPNPFFPVGKEFL
jgi:hypothetical protein